jgi:hypothetical protein
MRITKNNLVWYFIRPEEELPASYVKHVKKFFKSIGEKNVASSKILRRDEKKRKELERQASSNKHEEASSDKHQASSDKRQASEQEAIKIHEAWALANGYKHQATSSRDPDTRVLIIQSVRQIVAVMI